MKPPERLASILRDGRLLAFETYSKGDPAVCFTESSWPGFKFLMRKCAYEPWGLMVARRSVEDVGGGPVWYARPKQYWALNGLDPRLRSWAVRLDRGSSWLKEREWRIVPDPASGPWRGVPLSELRLAGLLVGDPQWPGTEHSFTPCVAGVPRFWWDPSSAQLQRLPPLF
jgi:hypothetical protein